MPEENIAPSPRSTTQCTDGSSAAARSASPVASTSSSLNALRFSGRLRTTWRTAPRSSVSTMAMGGRLPARRVRVDRRPWPIANPGRASSPTASPNSSPWTPSPSRSPSRSATCFPAVPSRTSSAAPCSGHALHPLLQLAPLGTWMSAVILDLIGGRGRRVGGRPADRHRACSRPCRRSSRAGRTTRTRPWPASACAASGSCTPPPTCTGRAAVRAPR